MNIILIVLIFILLICICTSTTNKYLIHENFIFGNVFNDIGRAFDNTVKDVGNAVDNVGRDIDNTVKNIGKDIDNAGRDIGNAVDNVGRDVDNTVKDVGNTVDNVSRDVGNTVDNVSRDVGNAVDNVGSDVDKMLKDFNPAQILQDLARFGQDLAKFGQNVGNNVNKIGDIFTKITNFDKIFGSIGKIIDTSTKMVPEAVSLLKVTGDIIPHLLNVLTKLLSKLKLLVQIMIILVSRSGNCAKFSIRFKNELITKFEFLNTYISNLINLSKYCSGGISGKNPITFSYKCGIYFPGYSLVIFKHIYKIVLAITETIEIIKYAPELFPQEKDKNYNGDYGGSIIECESKLNNLLGSQFNNEDWNKYVQECNQCLNYKSIINIKYNEIFQIKNILDELITILTNSKDLGVIIPKLTKLAEEIVINMNNLDILKK